MKPFLKWAGGKSALLPILREKSAQMLGYPLGSPSFKGRYFEPFLGGGALFFDQQPKRATLSDLNTELVATYAAVRDEPAALLALIETMPYAKEAYYAVRAADRQDGFQRLPEVWRAARFVYLNKCGYNGLYRVNSRGEHNVPFGAYKNPLAPVRDDVEAAHKALQRTTVKAMGFIEASSLANAGDFVYFDPPYKAMPNTSNFTAYTADGFDMKEHRKLAQCFHQLTTKGVHVMASNSAHPGIRALYEKECKQAEIITVSAPRRIGANAASRSSVEEFLITSKLKAARRE